MKQGYDDTSSVHATEESNSKEKILLFTALIVILVAALLVYSRWQSSSFTPKDGQDDNVINSTEEVHATTEPTPEPTTEPTPIPSPTPKNYTIDIEVTSIDDLYAEGVLEGTGYENRRFYCSQITPYLVKEKIPCEVFLYWDTLEILIVYDGKIVVLDQFIRDNSPADIYTAYRDVPEIYPCDFDGDGNYELLFAVRNFINFYDKDFSKRTFGTTIFHYDPASMDLQILNEFSHDIEACIYMKLISDSNFEIHRLAIYSSSTFYNFIGCVLYDEGNIVFMSSPSDSEVNDKDHIWSFSFNLDLDNDGITDAYKLEHRLSVMILKDENDNELFTFDVGGLFFNPSALLDVSAIDLNNDGHKEICFTSIENKFRNDTLVVTIALSKENGQYKRYFMSNYLGELVLKPLEQEGYYDLDWCVTHKHVYLNIPDPSFYTPDGDKKVIIKPMYSLPRSVKFDMIDGTPVVVIDWSMYIPGYSGNLETIVTSYLTLGTSSFDVNYGFEIEFFLGNPASNDDFIVDR